jgi:hypothetical protein
MSIQQLHLTPREHDRLRQVSYEKQVEAGMHDPGSAGLTANRLGDANPFVPQSERKKGGPVWYTELPQSEEEHKNSKLLGQVQGR